MKQIFLSRTIKQSLGSVSFSEEGNWVELLLGHFAAEKRHLWNFMQWALSVNLRRHGVSKTSCKKQHIWNQAQLCIYSPKSWSLSHCSPPLFLWGIIWERQNNKKFISLCTSNESHLKFLCPICYTFNISLNFPLSNFDVIVLQKWPSLNRKIIPLS